MKHNWNSIRDKIQGKISIRWGIFAGFALFTLVIVILLWVFQIALLESFYRSTKINEIQATGQAMVSRMEEQQLDLQQMEELITQTAGEKQISISLSDSSGRWAIVQKSSPTSFLDKLTWVDRAQIYLETQSVGGTYLYSQDNHNGQPDNMIYTMTFTEKGGGDRLLILYSGLTPV